MELVEQRRVGRQMRLDHAACLLVSRVAREHAVTLQRAACIRVGHEDGSPRGIEQDGIHRLGPEPRNSEHLPAQGRERHPAHAAHASAETRQQPPAEGLQPSCFDPIGSRRADDRGESGLAHGGDAIGTEEPPRAQRGHRASGVRPRRVLGEHGADRDLVRRPSRPPVLRPKAPLERHVQPQQLRLHRIRRRPRNSTPFFQCRGERPRDLSEGATPPRAPRPGTPHRSPILAMRSRSRTAA